MITLSWIEINQSIQMLSKVLQGRKVYGIPRGGTIIAGLLSYHGCELVTDLPYVMHHMSPVIFKESDHSTWPVIVDDIADTGETLKWWAEISERGGFETAALFMRESCAPQPHFYAHSISATDYIAFPWENLTEAIELEKKGVYKEHVYLNSQEVI